MGKIKSGKTNNNVAVESFKQNREKGYLRNRIFATVIDFIIISLLYKLAVVLLGAPDVSAYLEMQDVVRDLARDAPEVIARTKLWNDCFITILAIGTSYEALLLMLFNSTVGKLILGFRVTPINEDRGLILNKLFLILRAVVKGISLYLLTAIPYVFLCLTALGNPESRSGFDLCGGTRVIYKRRTKK